MMVKIRHCGLIKLIHVNVNSSYEHNYPNKRVVVHFGRVSV
jgi:hypothetical protein